LAGAGSRGRSETAKQLDLTTDQFNRRYDEQNKDLAQKGGELTRQMDKSQFELDRFKNDPGYRKQVRDADTAKLMPQVQAQIAADEAKRVAAETAGREQARKDKAQKASKELEFRLNSSSYYPPSPWFEFTSEDPPNAAAVSDSEAKAVSDSKAKAAENFVSRPEPEKPFLPTPTGDDNAANAAARSEVRNLSNYQQQVETQKRLDAQRGRENTEKNLRTASTIIQSRKPENTPGVSFRDSVQGPPSPQNAEAGARAQDSYVSLINSFTAPKVSRKPIVPGSKQDVDRQLKGLRGQ
jgi:hypothetical protein